MRKSHMTQWEIVDKKSNPKYQSIKTTNFETQIERDFNKGKKRPNRTHSS